MNAFIRNTFFALTALGLLSLAACKTTEKSADQTAPAASQPATDSGTMPPADDANNMPPATDSSTPPADSSSDQQNQAPPTP